jgi:radical SAM superfamily enzyme YgiQ (UPF0313 family)
MLDTPPAEKTPPSLDLSASSAQRGIQEVPAPRRLSICLLNPKFEPSYWGLDYALPLYPGDRRYSMIPGALPALAALADGHDVALIDENVEEIDFDVLCRFDIIGVTGMIVQKDRMLEILLQLRERGLFTAVGGPYATVNESFFHGLCDVLFLGEADETWPEFLADFAAGNPWKRVYQQAERTDLTELPRPRYDLLQVDRYASGSLQFSRGCPFQCEFCDIIVTFGRKPRTKRPDQVIAELEDLRAAGFHSVFIVDDNFIGNKKAARQLLEEIVVWQELHGYPLRLSTEASINLADDPALLDLLYRANFRYVFIGIETPRVESLLETKKFQNARGDSLEAKLERVQNAGIDVYGGFIVGFDHDDEAVFEEQYRFIQNNGIQLAMVGMLTAIPKTPLYERLEREGRLRPSDPNCNIIPKLMSPKALREGYFELVYRLYRPNAFLERYFRAYRFPEYHRRRAEISRKANEGKSLPTLLYGLVLLYKLTRTLAADGSLWSVGSVYLRYFLRMNLQYRRDLIGFAQFMNRCVTHWHFYRFTREATTGKLRLWNSS